VVKNLSKQLILHPKWKEAISQPDLELFERLVTKADGLEECNVSFISAKVARNYRDDLLATVLIVNSTDGKFLAEQIELNYFEKNQPLASNTFDIPSLIVEPNSITPWTFIFPANAVQGDLLLTDWKIDFKK
jgi:SLAP domain-containing protein